MSPTEASAPIEDLSRAPSEDAAHTALRTLRDRVPRLLSVLGLPTDEAVASWLQTLDTRILPRLSPDFPLMAAITGGGSTGKSTLFNSLLGAPLSTVGGRAGLNRRVLVAVHPRPASRPEFLTELFRPFGTQPRPLDAEEGGREALTTPGPPLYVTNENVPASVILLDTPDFDVGAAGRYLNRDVAAPVLTAADVLVYIFTNATYNAKANTDFIRDQLTRIGRRPCILVYRAYESFSDDEVRDHARTVAENLYGSDAQGHVLGLFRADDSNAVASGDAPMTTRRVGPGGGLLDTLRRIDPRTLRREQNVAMVADVGYAAAALVSESHWRLTELTIYRDALRLAEAHAVAAALAHLPLNRIVDRMREIFERTDPGFLRFSRKAGRITGAPFRGLMRLLRGRSEGDSESTADPAELMRSALVEAANGLRRQALAEELTAATTASDPDGAALLERIEALREARDLRGADRPLAERGHQGSGGVNVYVQPPDAVAEARRELLARDWSAEIEAVAEAAESLLELPAALDEELENIVREFREDLPFLKRARAALVASLNLIPPALGIVYVFATADPVGGSTLSAKLSSLFGLNDLWATVTIPASSGLDEATRRDLKRLLDPVVQRWLRGRANPIEALFRKHVTGLVLDSCAEVAGQGQALLSDIDKALGALPRGARHGP